MTCDHTFRLSRHAVILREGVNETEVLLLKATYGACSWGLPGRALEPGETIDQALLRECNEELGVLVEVTDLSVVYEHGAYQSQAFIFRCEIDKDTVIILSNEHSEYQFFAISTLPVVQKRVTRLYRV